MKYYMTKSNYVFVDSNVWVAMHNDKDALHKQALTLFHTIEKKKARILTSDYIVQEVFTVLSKRVDQVRALNFYHYIAHQATTDIIGVNDFFLQKIITFIQAKKLKKSLGLIDYSVLFFCRLVNCPIASFDQQLLQSAKKVGVGTW